MASVTIFATLATGLTSETRIRTPWIDTVVRMEALCAGDITSPIAYTAHDHCIGRVTNAMGVFRDNAAKMHTSAKT